MISLSCVFKISNNYNCKSIISLFFLIVITWYITWQYVWIAKFLLIFVWQKDYHALLDIAYNVNAKIINKTICPTCRTHSETRLHIAINLEKNKKDCFFFYRKNGNVFTFKLTLLDWVQSFNNKLKTYMKSHPYH